MPIEQMGEDYLVIMSTITVTPVRAAFCSNPLSVLPATVTAEGKGSPFMLEEH